MKKISSSLVFVSALLLSGCGDNDDKNENNETQALATSGINDRNDTAENTAKQYEFTVLKKSDDDISLSGKVSYEQAVIRCQNSKPIGHLDGGFTLPTLDLLESIDTRQLKSDSKFKFQEALSVEGYDGGLIIWTQDAKGFILYNSDAKDKEYIGDVMTRHFICVKPKN